MELILTKTAISSYKDIGHYILENWSYKVFEDFENKNNAIKIIAFIDNRSNHNYRITHKNNLP